MSLPEKMYDDLKRWTKNIIIGTIFVYVLFCLFFGQASYSYWNSGKHFLSILTIALAIGTFWSFTVFVAALIEFRELRWGRLLFGLVLLILGVFVGLQAPQL